MQLVGAGFSRSPFVSDGLGWARLPLSSGLLDLLDPDLLRREREYRRGLEFGERLSDWGGEIPERDLLSERPPLGDPLRDAERDGDPMLPDLDTSDDLVLRQPAPSSCRLLDLSFFTFRVLLSFSTKLSYKELLLTPRSFTLPPASLLLISSFTCS